MNTVAPMYTILKCHSPFGRPAALPTYWPDRQPDGELRTWKSSARFVHPPPQPVPIEIEEGESGEILELYDATIGLMSRRLAQALREAGVDNIDVYDATITDLATGQVFDSHVAFNIVGAVAAADLSKSRFSAEGGPLVAVDFDRLVLDESRARGLYVFRLAESVNAIVVAPHVKAAIEAAGIDTLSFVEPGQWVG